MQKRIFKKRLFTVILASLIVIGLVSETNYPENNAYAYDNSTKTVISMTSEGREQVRREEAAKRLEKIKQERERLEEAERRKKMPIEELITVVCEDYGISSEIPLAIARLETGHFTSSAYLNKNNPGGMSIDEVPITYSTREDGVEAFVSNLSENYFEIGLTTPESIAQKYCPVNSTNWASMVRQLM